MNLEKQIDLTVYTSDVLNHDFTKIGANELDEIVGPAPSRGSEYSVFVTDCGKVLVAYSLLTFISDRWSISWDVKIGRTKFVTLTEEVIIAVMEHILYEPRTKTQELVQERNMNVLNYLMEVQ